MIPIVPLFLRGVLAVGVTDLPDGLTAWYTDHCLALRLLALTVTRSRVGSLWPGTSSTSGCCIVPGAC